MPNLSHIVYYHNKFSGRAQPAQAILFDYEIEYEDKSTAEGKEVSSSFFAAPAILEHETGRVLGQTTAILAHLGNVVGANPHPGCEAEGLKLACDIADIWSESYKLTNLEEWRVCNYFFVL